MVFIYFWLACNQNYIQIERYILNPMVLNYISKILFYNCFLLPTLPKNHKGCPSDELKWIVYKRV